MKIGSQKVKRHYYKKLTYIFNGNKERKIMKYISISDAAKGKKVSRTAVYLAIARDKLDTKYIAGRQVIILNDKYNNYHKTK